MSLLPWTPRISYGSGPTHVALTHPMRPWDIRGAFVGGHRVLSSGVALGFKIRRDRLVDLQFRVMEWELATFTLAIEWAQDNPQTAITIRADIEAGATTDRSVYVRSPQGDVEYTPERGEYFGALIVPVTIVRADGAAWGLTYFAGS